MGRESLKKWYWQFTVLGLMDVPGGRTEIPYVQQGIAKDTYNVHCEELAT
jgi:hypothetical protein